MIEVRLFRLGSRKVDSYIFEENYPTVGDLLKRAGEEYERGKVTMNTADVGEYTTLHDRDTVYLLETMRGNISELPFEVKFYRLGSRESHPTCIPVYDGNTIKQALDQLDANDKAKFYGVDGEPAYEYQVSEGERTVKVKDDYVLIRPDREDYAKVICAQKLKGNILWLMIKKFLASLKD